MQITFYNLNEHEQRNNAWCHCGRGNEIQNCQFGKWSICLIKIVFLSKCVAIAIWMKKMSKKWSIQKQSNIQFGSLLTPDVLKMSTRAQHSSELRERLHDIHELENFEYSQPSTIRFYLVWILIWAFSNRIIYCELSDWNWATDDSPLAIVCIWKMFRMSICAFTWLDLIKNNDFRRFLVDVLMVGCS